MAQQIQLRRGTAAQWTTANTILLQGELGFETDTLLYKLGDGATAWTALAYKGLTPTLQNLSLEVPATEPTAPGAGYLNLYPWSTAGRIMPKFIGPSALDTFLQPALFASGLHFVTSGAGTAPTVFGGPALSAVGTVSHPSLAATNLVTQTSRFICTSAATANSVSEFRAPATRVWRGNIAELGGFFHRTRFHIESATANQQMFIGFNQSVAAFSTTQVPSALVQTFGIGFDSADTSLQIMSNGGTTTKVALGASFPVNDNTVMYNFTCFCAPNSSQITYAVRNLKSGAMTTGTVTANLPTSTVFMGYHAYMNNGGTAAAVVLGLSRIYTETVY